MDSKNIIQSALSLSPAERLFIIETPSKSLANRLPMWKNFGKKKLSKDMAPM